MVLRSMNRQATLDGLDLYRRLDRPHPETTVDDDGRITAVLDQLHSDLKVALSRPSVVRGWRAQALFASTVIALDGCEMMTQVDLGEVFVDGDDAKAPDFFLHLRGGRRILVDVKSAKAPAGVGTLQTFSAKDVARMRRFGDLYAAEVFLAFYFSSMTLWALVSLDDLTCGPGGGYRISFEDVVRLNKMGLLGDRSIGVETPLSFTVFPDASQPNKIDDHGRAELTVGAVSVSVAGRELLEPQDRRVATFLMTYGTWSTAESTQAADGKLLSATWSVAPDELLNEGLQDFEVIGTLSSMYATAFELGTTGPAGYTGLQIEPDPGALIALIPHDYASENLPLWRFEQVQ
ncbi:hypothetical protein RWH45_06560 [Microbacterium sp. KSW4-17]|uniref:PD-(D/E)XK endonuclease-like domain-containing protein n=1 Tax=Microbacterium galbum TaxID=3075994 RepID=A0ABU3T671_9MICO|nr:hypothetical protein [Microbacterium sp. KSW4-17]MDU0366871.1 hypothetical protein [Microbacterium sp. KSW4-17]